MSDHVTLLGADDVRGAGYRMIEAARDMNTAASSIDYALARHQQFLEDWLTRLADVLASASRQPGATKRCCCECGAEYLPGNPVTCPDCRSKRWRENLAAKPGGEPAP